MIDIATNYDRTVNILRLAAITDTEREEYAVLEEDVICHIQPLDDAASEDLQGNFGKNWLMFCDYRDVQERDKIVDDLGVEYLVVAVERFDFLGMRRHMELSIRKSIGQ